MPWSREMWFWCPGAPFTGRRLPPDRPMSGIFYTLPGFLQKASTAETDLGSCFRLAAEKYSYAPPDREVRIVRLLETLRDSQAAPGYGQELLDKALVTQFLIAVTRDLEARQLQYVASASCDEKIVSILKYRICTCLSASLLTACPGSFISANTT